VAVSYFVSDAKNRMCLPTIPSDDDKVFGEFSDGVNDAGRFEIARFSSINVEGLDGVLDNSMEVLGR
jgi:hypothetical protein